MPASRKHLSVLIELAYSATIEPGGWAALLRALCDALESKSAALATYDFASGSAQLHAAVGADPADLPLYEHYSPKNPLMPAVARYARTGFLGSSSQSMPESELRKTEYFNEYMRRVGYHHNLGLCVERVGDVATMIYPARDLGRPPFSKQDFTLCRALLPHLCRAFLIHRRVVGADLQRMAATRALDQILLGVCILDSSGRALFVNRSASSVFDTNDGLTLGREGLMADRPHESTALRRAITEATRAVAAELRSTGSALRISRPSHRRSFEVFVVPLTVGQRVIPDLVSPSVVVFICDPAREPPRCEAAFAELYRLTPAESRLARCLLAGHRLEESADTLGITVGTARVHLKRVFDKIGVRSQSELMRVLLIGPASIQPIVSGDAWR